MRKVEEGQAEPTQVQGAEEQKCAGDACEDGSKGDPRLPFGIRERHDTRQCDAQCEATQPLAVRRGAGPLAGKQR